MDKQTELIGKINKIGINIVFCGCCGGVFLHDVGLTELTCPYCDFTEDICHFPDFIVNTGGE